MFYPDEAKINRGATSKVVVSSEEVATPAAVRYGFKNFVDGILYDDAGLPLSSFRTDNW